MTSHLLALSIGPVQDFIAAARRTRDLWFGSYLLSEISKAGARAVAEKGGLLIFPAPSNMADLAGDSALTVANVVLAELPANLKPESVRQFAYVATQDCWKCYAKMAKEAVGSLVNDDIWLDQEGDIIEFYAAWTPLVSPEQYREARQRVMRLLAGRKACRDFVRAKGRAGIAKSSLDGARETVLVCGESQRKTRRLRRDFLKKDQKKDIARRLRLSVGEELDVIGVTKRAATKESFPSIVRVAADPWIRGIERQDNKAADMLRQIAERCKDAAFATGTGKYYHGIFPYDGAILYPSRLIAMMRVPETTREGLDDFDNLLSGQDRSTLGEIRTLLNQIQKPFPKGQGCGEPVPYLAILAADGDRMGKTISEIDSPTRHRQFSKKLVEFAGKARDTVQARSGCLVYSGGDDVLAFVPVDQCLDCARALHGRFDTLMAQWKDEKGQTPTLSVGLAIGHCLEPMEDLLEYGRAAEKAAKTPNRNGLAVHFHSRGGVPIKIRAQWSAGAEGLDGRLETWATLHEKNQIPDKAAYDLRELARDYESWPTETPEQQAALSLALRSDALRMIKQKRGGLGDEGLAELERLLKDVNSVEEAFHVADEIILARRIADVQLQTKGGKIESRA